MRSVQLICTTALALAALALSVAMAAEKPREGFKQFATQETFQNGAIPISSGAVVKHLRSGPTRTVSGHRIAHYKDGLVPIDLSIRVVAAYVPNGAGGYDEIVGTGTSDGTYTIPNVPSGFYLLRLARQFLWTAKTKVNADYYQDFRSTAVQPVDYTTLTFDLANLNPWQDTDIFELSGRTPAFALFPGVAGETTFTGTFPYSTYTNDTTQGDKPYFLQLVTQPAGGYAFTAAARSYAPRNLVQVDGTDTTVSGTLKTISQNQTFRANINGADLAAQALAANPNAVLVDTTLALDAYPGSMAKGQTVSTPDLVAYSLGTGMPPLNVNMDMGDLFYGNPFPSRWPLFMIYQYSAQTSYLAPGAWNSALLPTIASGATTAMPTPTSPIQPMVGTVSGPSIQGSSFFANQTGIGLTPTLNWSPPEVGAADVYAVYIYQLVNNAGNTEYGQIARLQTQSTSITIPPGLLSLGPTTGQGYVFMIRAFYRPGVDVAAKPYVAGPIGAQADVISGVMQP